MTGWEAQIRHGVVELAVLAAIGRGESYGYGIVSELQRLEGLALSESTVYPVLARLARRGSGGSISGFTIGSEPALLPADNVGPAAAARDGGELQDGF